MPTTPTRTANGILQNAQSGLNPANGTAGNEPLRTGNKVIQRITPSSGFGVGKSSSSNNDNRLMTALLPGVKQPGIVSVTHIGGSSQKTPSPVNVEPNSISAGPLQDVYTQAIGELQKIIANPELGRRNEKDTLGNVISVIDRPKLQALQGVIDTIGQQFKTQTTRDVGEAQTTVGEERNRLTGLGIQEKARARLSKDISREEARKIDKEQLFQEKLKLFSPAGSKGPNATAGLFRLAFSGDEIPPSYKKRADNLLLDFNIKYKEYLRKNSFSDTEENRQTYADDYFKELL